MINIQYSTVGFHLCFSIFYFDKFIHGILVLIIIIKTIVEKGMNYVDGIFLVSIIIIRMNNSNMNHVIMTQIYVKKIIDEKES
jgi:hypothetical protein